LGRYERVTEVAGRVTAQLPDMAQSAAFRNFARRYANIIARTFDALGIEPTFERLKRATENIDPLLIKYCLFWLRENGRRAGGRTSSSSRDARRRATTPT